MDSLHAAGRGGEGGRVKFERITDWAEVSECGRYTVSASMDSDGLKPKAVKRYLFTAWRRNSNGPPDILLIHAEAEKCRDACREHAAKVLA